MREGQEDRQGIQPKPVSQPDHAAAEDENSGGTNWPEVVRRYEASRVGTGQVKVATNDREERRRIELTIELINAKGRGAALPTCFVSLVIS